MADKGILLESGTNELEIVEFQVNEIDDNGDINRGYYGVNVAKVREIITAPKKMADVPRAHSAVAGVVNLRGKIIPIVNLPDWLGKKHTGLETARVVITEFNNILSGFLVHKVDRIHRVSWSMVETPTGIMTQAERECVTGIVKLDDRILMMLDFERIVTEINPSVGMRKVNVTKSDARAGKTIFIAEDSGFIRNQIVSILEKAGYRVFTAADGKEALTKLLAVAKQAEDSNTPIDRYLNLLVTDVEMPQMDGLHLTIKVKENHILSDVPVIIFSSLVNEENKRKWSAIGAAGYITKPEMDRLLGRVDSLLL